MVLSIISVLTIPASGNPTLAQSTSNWAIDLFLPILVVLVVSVVRLFCDKVVNKKELAATLFSLPTEVVATIFVIPCIASIKSSSIPLKNESVAAILFFFILIIVSVFLGKRGLDAHDKGGKGGLGLWLTNALLSVVCLIWAIALLARI